jgi:protein tyrosine/serine phosphatase
MSEADGPYLVHCTEGKDRTGFICMLIEALAGASYDEIVDDYMITYDNYYEITEVKDKAKYDVILEKNLIAMLYTVVGDKSVDLKTADLSAYAKDYLKDLGMTDLQIEAFLAKLTD